MVPNNLQHKTSSILQWVDICQSENLDNCPALDPYYDAVKKFRSDTPDAGAYFNEADFFEEDWQDTFWGMENYLKLLDIKDKWDPNHLFYCHNCVGSEFWEEGGMCRRQHPKI